jgi:hypothetical protein
VILNTGDDKLYKGVRGSKEEIYAIEVRLQSMVWMPKTCGVGFKSVLYSAQFAAESLLDIPMSTFTE